MGRPTKGIDVHYALRASERGSQLIPIKHIVNGGYPIEKRRAFFRKKEKEIKAFLFYGQVHILSSDLKKRITVMPYSKRKWKFIVK